MKVEVGSALFVIKVKKKFKKFRPGGSLRGRHLTRDQQTRGEN